MTGVPRRSYIKGMALAVLSSIMICVLIGAVGIIGVEGDPFDRLYFTLLGLGWVSSLIGGFKARHMRYTVTAMALGMGLILSLEHFFAGSSPAVMVLVNFVQLKIINLQFQPRLTPSCAFSSH